MRKLVFGLFVLSIALTVFYNPDLVIAGFKDKSVWVTVKSSPNASYETTYKIRNRNLANRLLKAKKKSNKDLMPLSDVTLHVGKRQFSMDRKGNVYDLKKGKQLILPESVDRQLLQYAAKTRKNHYGELVPWKEVDNWIPQKAVFSVKDLETGKTFNVQRRAGSAHADVQPLTKEDTKTMKKVYSGKWSWRRRAILVKIQGRYVAASMHGMPHGAGALKNGFPGHFCIHFHDSTTHRTKRVDPSHEIMTYKAAGQVDKFLDHASPYEIADAFFVAVNNKDMHLLKKLLDRRQSDQVKALVKNIRPLDAIKPSIRLKDKGEEKDLVAVRIPIDTRLYKDGRLKANKKLKLLLLRNAPGERWLIDTQALLESLE